MTPRDAKTDIDEDMFPVFGGLVHDLFPVCVGESGAYDPDNQYMELSFDTLRFIDAMDWSVFKE